MRAKFSADLGCSPCSHASHAGTSPTREGLCHLRPANCSSRNQSPACLWTTMALGAEGRCVEAPTPVTVSLEFRKRVQRKHLWRFALNPLPSQTPGKKNMIYLYEQMGWFKSESTTSQPDKGTSGGSHEELQWRTFRQNEADCNTPETNNKHNMPFCHLHIKGSTRLTERKITFSGSYYAEIIFMAKLGINAFLRQIPTFVNIDNLLVAIRGKCIRCLLQTFPAVSEQKFKASSERQPAGQRSVHRHWATRFPHRGLPGTVCLPLGPPRHGDVTFLNCNLFRKSRVLLGSVSQLLSLRKTSWEWICFSYDIRLH